MEPNNTGKKKILVVEDERNIAEVLKYNIRREGYDCDVACDGEEGLKMALAKDYDLILLDIMLPKMTGFEVCEKIRYTKETPIIFVTAREDEKDRVLGLETGADDYVTKPFSFPELKARIKANIRRSSGEVVTNRKKAMEQKDEAAGKYVTGNLVIDGTRSTVTKSGEPVELSKKECDIMVFLAENMGETFTREQLLDKIWGYDDYYGDIRVVDVTFTRLRKKLEADPKNPEYLLTKRGVGYYLCKR